MESAKLLSPAGFGIAMFCFLLPFLELKCNDEHIATVKGISMVTGAQLSINDDLVLPGDPNIGAGLKGTDIRVHSLQRNYFAIASFLLAFAGFILSFLDFMKKKMMLSAAGLGGVLALLLMRVQLDALLANDAGNAGRYLLHIDYVYGYWLTIACLLLAGLSNMLEHIDTLKKNLREND